MSRSTVWRVLTEADLQPHRSSYWLNGHAPDFEARIRESGRLYLDAPALWQASELVLSTDEKTGILIRRRKHPTKPIRLGLAPAARARVRAPGQHAPVGHAVRADGAGGP